MHMNMENKCPNCVRSQAQTLWSSSDPISGRNQGAEMSAVNPTSIPPLHLLRALGCRYRSLSNCSFHQLPQVELSTSLPSARCMHLITLSTWKKTSVATKIEETGHRNLTAISFALFLAKKEDSTGRLEIRPPTFRSCRPQRRPGSSPS
jgi:hypothetical protein